MRPGLEIEHVLPNLIPSSSGALIIAGPLWLEAGDQVHPFADSVS